MAELSDLFGLSSISDITLSKMNDSIQGMESWIASYLYNRQLIELQSKAGFNQTPRPSNEDSFFSNKEQD